MKYCYLFLLLFVFASCKNLLQNSERNQYKDKTVQHIHNLKNERNTQALLPFLKSENDIYRREAALAFASVQDDAAFKDLALLLRDPSAEVCLQAAFALGQLGNAEAESPLITAIEKEKIPQVEAEMLQALGKICTEDGLAFISNYNSTDSITSAGQAWALYRAGIRKIYSQEGITLAAKFLSSENSLQTRLAAAHFFARSPNLELSELFENLQETALNDKSAFVRMAAVQAMANVEPGISNEIMLQIISNDPDYRVKINALRVLQKNNADLDNSFLHEVLYESHPHTALTAAQYLLANGSKQDLPMLQNLAEETENWRVRATLYAAMMRYSGPEEKMNLTETLLAKIKSSGSEYEKGLLIKALSENPANLDLLISMNVSEKNPVVRTYTMEALVDMRKQLEFPEEKKAVFQEMLIKSIESGDVALIGLAAGLLREPALDFRKEFTEIKMLQQAQNRLTLPRDIESFQELQRTIEYLSGSDEQKDFPRPNTSHPINWNIVKDLSATSNAVINTAKGNITIEFFTNEAPATVANFIELAKKGFYENKNFHRVVPNFVAQAGCPRGDGWGSSDYTIRSEFAPLQFGEGYLGMASAGKDTESCQWFITHSPTPHLDGRYTIFAKVVSGMEVVHQLNIGDKIIKIEVND